MPRHHKVQLLTKETKPHQKDLLIQSRFQSQTHHDDADTNADPADDVQFVVEHLADGSWTVLRVTNKTNAIQHNRGYHLLALVMF